MISPSSPSSPPQLVPGGPVGGARSSVGVVGQLFSMLGAGAREGAYGAGSLHALSAAAAAAKGRARIWILRHFCGTHEIS